MEKSVFITGATVNTGLGIAEKFAKEGYNLFLGSRNAENAEKTAKELSEKYGVYAKQFFDVSIDDFMNVINTNIGWNFMLSREAAIQMKENGGGSIVFVNSNTAYRAIPDRIAYSASKSGALGMMRALALDLGKYNIRVNAVLPGMIKTDRWESNYNDCRSALSNYTPLGDIADFEDIANAVWYFGSDNSKNTTGAELTVDGGNMIQLYPIVSEK